MSSHDSTVEKDRVYRETEPEPIEVECPSCQGTGEGYGLAPRCSACRGTGIAPRRAPARTEPDEEDIPW